MIKRTIWKPAAPLAVAALAATVVSSAQAAPEDEPASSARPIASPAVVVFADPAEFKAGKRSWSVAYADFNGDGKLDAATGNGGNSLSVLSGNGDGTFGARTDYPAPKEPYFLTFDVTTADFNGDGKPDLALAGGNPIGNVGIYLNKGDGTFDAPRTVPVGYGPNQITTGDLNRDGKADLITANNFAANITVRLGRGDGTFGPEKRYNIGPGPQGVTVADVNGDRVPDVLTGNFGRIEDSLSVLIGRGDGTFRDAHSYAAGETVNDVVVGDFNRDGVPDVAVGEFVNNKISVLLGKRWGGFGPARKYDTGTGLNELTVGDFNGDGALDIASTVSPDANRDPSAPPPNDPKGAGVSVLLGHGDGTFAGKTHYTMPGTVAAVKAADVNKDGRTDLLGVNLANESLVVWVNKGNK
ncbi:FG-GAP repeat domain-containing protein [Kibdelosporangium phytohabitans]|uniref:VCBS repeat-containing protein n=1 Tax=Kibdelosporangium phytohabitans TaxID=860235 RepID=A0A0N9I1Y4_9PSEU|nr:VCBS repeat-containing protein [Kibdelosporangium phytohabitans]ALG08716.1 hypothetical protein AOZ06_18940 [Kibdelosporangium phytohabitans]MBE1470171.1 hypothetical protein [Kibdelosporangium phytohabitans]